MDKNEFTIEERLKNLEYSMGMTILACKELVEVLRVINEQMDKHSKLIAYLMERIERREGEANSN